MLGSIFAIQTLNEMIPNQRNLITENDANYTNERIFAPIGLTLLNKEISASQGFSIELILTFILVFCIFACIDLRRKDIQGSFPYFFDYSTQNHLFIKPHYCFLFFKINYRFRCYSLLIVWG
jgi:hypothetical protein